MENLNVDFLCSILLIKLLKKENFVKIAIFGKFLDLQIKKFKGCKDV